MPGPVTSQSLAHTGVTKHLSGGYSADSITIRSFNLTPTFSNASIEFIEHCYSNHMPSIENVVDMLQSSRQILLDSDVIDHCYRVD